MQVIDIMWEIVCLTMGASIALLILASVITAIVLMIREVVK